LLLFGKIRNIADIKNDPETDGASPAPKYLIFNQQQAIPKRLVLERKVRGV